MMYHIIVSNYYTSYISKLDVSKYVCITEFSFIIMKQTLSTLVKFVLCQPNLKFVGWNVSIYRSLKYKKY